MLILTSFNGNLVEYELKHEEDYTCINAARYVSTDEELLDPEIILLEEQEAQTIDMERIDYMSGMSERYL